MRLQLPYGFSTPRDILGKLQRDADRLKTEVNPDNTFNFMVTSHSLLDWISAAIAGDTTKEADLETLRDKNEIRICRDLSNASKHFELKLDKYPNTKYPPLAQAVIIVQPTTYGSAIYGVGTYGGTGSTTIETNQGQEYELTELKDEVLRVYSEFLTKHGLA